MRTASDMYDPSRPKPKRSLPRRIVRASAWLVAAWIVGTIVAVAVLRFVHPPTSAFMVERRLSAIAHGPRDFTLRYRWTPWEQVSKTLPISLVAAEDQKFPFHHGFDLDAIQDAIEDAEDSWETGSAEAATVRPGDVVIGLAASGSTPYVGGALEQARKVGATTALVACVPAPRLAGLADILVVADTGPEVVAGSTRLKAWTAEKLVINSFSTALMISLGYTWRGLMVSVVATNAKLRDRTGRILAEVTEQHRPATAPRFHEAAQRGDAGALARTASALHFQQPLAGAGEILRTPE